MTITLKQKQILEKQLKEIKLSYFLGFGLGIVFFVVAFISIKSISRTYLFGFEEYLKGEWTFIWSLLLWSLVFFGWIRGNKLADKKREIELKLAEEVVG